MSKTQTDYLTQLAYIMGETTVNSANNRKAFVQTALEEVYEAYPWPFNQAISALTLASGVAALPTTFERKHGIKIRYATDSEGLEEIEINDQDAVNEGDNRYWLTADGDGTYSINSKETDRVLQGIYQKIAPVLASESSLFENTMVVALGARRYLKMADNPDADVSQDDAIFDKQLQKAISQYQVKGKRRQTRTKQSTTGYYTGRA